MIKVRKSFFATICLCIIVFKTIFNSRQYGTLLVDILPYLLVFFATTFLTIILSMKNNKVKVLPDTVICMVIVFTMWYSTLVSKTPHFVRFSSAIYMLVFVLFYIVVINVRFSPKECGVILVTYVLCMAFVSLNTVLNYYNSFFYIDNRTSFYFGGVYKDPNYVAALIAPTIGIYLMFMSRENKIWKKILALCGMGISMVGILLTGSRGAMLAVGVGIIVYVYLALVSRNVKLKYKLLLTIFALIFIFVVLKIMIDNDFYRFLDIVNYKSNIRLEIWNDGMEFWKNNPIIGNGVESTSNYTLTRWYHYATHNCFIDIIGDTGLIGLLCYIYLLANNIIKSKKKRILCLFIVLGFGPLFFINGYYTMNFWIILGLCYIVRLYVSEDYVQIN